MGSCVFLMVVLGLGPTNDTPRDIKIFDCGEKLRFELQGKEVFIYDFVEDESLYIYEEKK